MDTDSDLDDYVAALRKLKLEIDQYGDVAGALQKVSAAILTSNQTLRNSQGSLNEFVQSAGVQLTGVQSSLDATVAQIRDLGLDSIFEQLSGRYDMHQSRLDELAKSVEDAVREQQRLGLQLLQQTTAFQSELTALSAQLRLATQEANEQNAEMKSALTRLPTDLNAIGETIQKRISSVEQVLSEADSSLRSDLSTNSQQVGRLETALQRQFWMMLLVVGLAATSIAVALVK